MDSCSLPARKEHTPVNCGFAHPRFASTKTMKKDTSAVSFLRLDKAMLTSIMISINLFMQKCFYFL